MKNKLLLTGLVLGLLSIFAFSTAWTDVVNNNSAELGPNDIMVSVFQDFNGDGIRQASTEPLIPGLTLTAYNNANAQVAQDNVGTNGNYLLTVGAGTGVHRVEVTGLPANLQPGAVGTSTVFFASANQTVQVALENPDQYSQDNPPLVTTCFNEGPQPLMTGETFIRFDYESGCFDAGINGTCDDGGTFDGPKTGLATSNDIGSTFGVAYQRATRSAFVASYMKRHAGFKSNGRSGVIYRVQNPETASPTITEYIDFDALGIPTKPVSGDPHPSDAASALDWELDNNSWDWVGKMSFGDLDISEDGETLFVVNLFDRRLYYFPAKSTPYTLADAAMVQSVALPQPCGNAIDARPFGLGVYNGKVYFSMICSGESTIGAWAGGKIPANTACTVSTLPAGSRAALSGNIYEYDPVTGIVNNTPVLTFPLNYGRGRAINSSYGPTSATWNPWVRNWTVFNRPPRIIPDGMGGIIEQVFQDRSYPQPMISDIEFDNGNMILGLRDRFGDQTGHLQSPPTGFTINQDPDPGNASTPAFLNMYDGVAEGDILRACGSPSAGWTLESGGACGGVSGAPAPNANSNGPGGGEYYAHDDYTNFHNEIAQGGMVQVPGHEDIVTIVTDPINSLSEFYDAGIVWYRNSDGQRVQNFLFFSTAVGVGDDDGPTFAKANGLGDMIALSDPTPIQIGNRVWFDTNDDGIQSPNEPGINGVTVELYKDIGGTMTKVAETVTAASATQGNGAFKFTNSTEQTWSNGQTEVLPNMDYEIRVSLANITAQMANVNAFATQDAAGDVTNNNKTDLSDSDVTTSGVIAFSTGDAGENNHTLDIGVKAACELTVNSAVPSACNILTNEYTLEVSLTYLNAPVGESITITTDNGASQTFSPAGVSGTESFTLSGLTADGAANIDVTATYVTTTTCTDDLIDAYTAPENCVGCNIVSLTASASGCNSDDNSHNVAGTITVTNAPTSGTLTVLIPGFGGGMQTFDAPFTSPINYSIDGVASNGLDRSVIATFSDNGGMCADTVTYLAPEQCLSCTCNNFIYLNEPGAGTVLKFRVEADSTLTLVGNPFASGINSPHGLGIDNNGFIYVGSFGTGRINKYSCDGTFIETLPASITVQQQNTVVKGNYLYASYSATETVECFDLCTYQRVGYLDFAGTGGSWGLSEGEDGNLYVAGGSSGQPVIVYQFPPDPALFKLTDITVYDTPYWDTNPGLTGTLTGIDVDEFGNVYLAIIDQGTIYKVAPDGTILFQVTDPGVGNGSGWANAFGIVYNRETKQLYTSQNNQFEDCIAVFDAADLTYRADLIVPANPPLTGKGIGILQECCPTLDSVRVDTTICALDGTKFELNQLLPCPGLCAQPTPSGGWTRTSGTGGTFDECDLSFTTDDLTTSSCFEFAGGSIGGACFPYKIEICFDIVEMTPPEIAGNVCSDPAGEELSVSVLSTGVSNITYQWQRSTIGCLGFLDIPGATGLTYTPTSPAQRTFYRVKATSPDGLACEQFSNCLRVELDTMATTTLCSGGTNSVTFNAAAGLTDVVWFNEADVEVGTGASLLVSGLTPGLEDGQENFRYTALDAEGEPYPSACPFRAVTSVVSLTASAGNCDNDNNGHNVAGTITVTNPPATGTLTVMIPGFGGGMQTFDAPFTSPINYSIDGVASNGLDRSVIATFSDNSGTCADTVTYLAPEQCLSCTCNNFIYLNEPNGNKVLKFRVEQDSTLTLVSDPFAPTTGPAILSPHGIGIDANGFLYIGSATTQQIFKYTCDGTYVETLPFTVLQTNTVVKGNYLYTTENRTNFVQCFDLCTNQRVGYLDFAGIGASWGLSEGEDGNLYVAGGTLATGAPIIVYQFPPDPSLFKLTNITVYNTPYFTNDPGLTGVQTGIDVDEFGNVYLADFSPGTVYKVAPDGTVLAQVTDPTAGNGSGWRNAFGLVYNRETQQVYTTQNNPQEDCIAVFDAADLTYRPDLIVPASPPFIGKGIGILEECCPTLDSIRIDTTVCATAGVSFELNELLPCSGLCAQPTPNGGWTRTDGTGGTFNECDLSFTVDEVTTSSCFKFSGGSIGGACFPYVIDICFNIVEMTPPEISGPVCSDPAGEELSVSVLSTGVSNITYQWQRSTIGCLGFLDIPGAIGLTYTPTSPAQRTFYRVKATSPDGLACEQFSNCLRVELDTMATTTLCSGGTNSVTFNAAAGLTDVVWFNEADVEVGTGASLLVSGLTPGLEDGQENFRYTALDAEGEPYPSACPFRVLTEPCLDYGDLPVGYPTTLADNGPSHVLVSGLGIGATIDEEADGVPSVLADGDGADEDGIAVFPVFNPGQPAPITVSVMNNQPVPADAILYGFIDWNGDGDFDDANEMVSIPVPDGANGDVVLPFIVPDGAVTGTDLGVRIRLSTETGLGATGPATDGEIEDYLIQVPPCNLAISSVQVDCSDGTTFMVSFSVDYDFVNAAAGMIEVSVGGVAQPPISPSGTSGMVPIGPVSLPGPAYDVLITADFTNNSSCSAVASVDLIACTDPCTDALGGNVFNDFDNDGADAGAVEGGQANVLVEIYECDNDVPVATTYTNADGDWSVDDSGITYPVRVEFSTPLQDYLQSSFAGDDNGTNTQFVEAPTCEVDYGVADPAQYCNENPLVAVVCFPRNNDAGGEPIIVFLATEDARDWPGPEIPGDTDGRWGIPSGANIANYPAVASTFATKTQIETTFGLDWDSKNAQLYSGAYMRAYASMGSNSSANGFAEGAIYNIPIDLVSSSSMTPAVWLDLETLFGDDFAGTYIADTPFPGPQVYGRNGNNPNLIGYTGLGSIKLAADNSEMYVVNLASREVLVIPIGEDGSAPTSAAEIKRFPIPNTPCDGAWSDGRPVSSVLGLGVHPESGRVYATMTCTGPDIADVTGYVYSFDPADDTPATTDFTLELTIPLDIDRPAASPNTNRFWGQIDHAWETLAANAVSYNNDPRIGGNIFNPLPQELNSQHTQPWLGEVGFAIQPDGTYAMVVGERNRYHDIINSSFYVTGGVLYRACGEEGNWTLENDGSCGSTSSSVAYTMSGTRAGQYVSPQNQFFYYVGREGTMGAGTVDIPFGSSEVVIPAMDNIFNSSTSGLSWLSTVDGGRLRDARILGDFTPGEFDNTNFTKANNWGSITTLCESLPIQIGNYVWLDEDEDGVQDACEDPLTDLPVTLYTKDDNGTLTQVAMTTTDAVTGEYYFNDVIPDTTYLIVFGDTPESDTSFVYNNTEYGVTQDSTGEGNNPGLNDSDATFQTSPLGNLPSICYRTADTTDHTLDVGLVPLAVFDLALVKRLDLVANPGPFGPDSTVTFEIEVYNQGDTDATDIEVKDYVPNGLSLAPASAPDWTISADTAILTTPFSLVAGDSLTLSISFVIDNDFMGDTLTNRAEISSFDDDNDPLTDPPVDEDSTPNDNGADDPEVNTPDEYDDDGDGTPGVEDDPNDEDDYDFEGIPVVQTFDLSLIKTLDTGATPGPFSLGSTVTFAIRVSNQGSLDATEVEVSDYVPDGLTLVPSADWMMEVDTARLENPFDLAAGASITLSISFTIDNDFMGDRIDNVAEITDAVNALGLPDEDSRFGDNGGDDPEFGSDDEEDDDGLNGNGSPDDPADSDDFDFAPLDIQRFSIGSTVFEDEANNGIQDGTDEGIPMVEVQLYQVVGAKDDDMNGETDDVLLDVGSDGDLATATDGQPYVTDAQGDYYFSSLMPGDYYVVIPDSEFAAGEPLEFINVSSTDIATSDGDNQTDGDDNGLQPAGRAMAICSPVINLAFGEEPTDAGAQPENQQGNLQDNAQDANGDMTIDMGLFAPVCVGDTAFIDLDMDGIQSAGDEPLPGVIVTLYDTETMMPYAGTDVNGSTVDPQVTGMNGDYKFRDLPPGDYYVVFDLTNIDNADLYDFTTPNVGGDDATDSDALPAAPTDLMAPSGPTGPLASGEADLTLDAGVVCAIEVTVADPFTICATGTVDLLAGASVTPNRLGATWRTPDGTGTFVDAAGDPLTEPYELGTAVSYVPSAADAVRGFVTLTLTSNDPGGLAPPSSCDAVEASIRIDILNVDCGQFIWDGNDD